MPAFVANGAPKLSSKVTVRLATWLDLRSVFAFRESLERYGAVLTGIPLDTSQESIERAEYATRGWFHEPGWVVLLAERGGVPVGYAVLMDFLFVGRAKGVGCAGLFVVESARKTAATFALVRQVKRLLMATKTERTQAVVMVGNETMHRNLRKLGFREVATVYHREISHGPNVRAEEGE